MPKRTVRLESLLPEGAFAWILPMLTNSKVALKLTARRGQRLGAYQRDRSGHQTILINILQDPYSLFITFLHEIAHMQVRNFCKGRPQPHGPEWKQAFSRLLMEASALPSLPDDIRGLMRQMAKSPKSRQFSTVAAGQVLIRYSLHPGHEVLLCDLPEGARFQTPDGKTYVKGERIRTRYKCQKDGTSSWWLIGGSVPVKRVA
ncbi:MAG TPA: hypothetical protein P5228_00820 [Bacteroidales bacterium]|nr:hypothetical protein [Bacteroidales bacterium]HRZ47903.1 hypothetical protein [Bacteroidales bacterium]